MNQYGISTNPKLRTYIISMSLKTQQKERKKEKKEQVATVKLSMCRLFQQLHYQ